MRRFAALTGALLLLIALAGPALAAPSTARAVIHEDFGRRASARPCTQIAPTVLACAGDGVVAGFGRVTSLGVYTATPIVTRTITFADGSTLTIEETYADPSFPGNSLNAPGSILHSFGNPYRQTFTWRIVGSTGNASGTTGSGTGTLEAAGDTLVFKFEGTTQQA